MITTGARIGALIGISVLLLGAAGLYLVRNGLGAPGPSWAGQPGDDPRTGPAGTDPAGLLGAPHIVFRSAALGADYGRLAVVAVADPGGPRAVLDVDCERVYATATAGTCVAARRGIPPRYALVRLDDRLRPAAEQELAGLPSRARMSLDGSLAATTTFVTGHSYAGSSFSTETVIWRGTQRVGNLEEFRTMIDGRPLTAIDRNFWGVTFAADNNTFYATAAVGDQTWLVRGSLAERTLTGLRANVECPSLSPDGRAIAYKKRLSSTGEPVWRIAVLDLASGTETMIADERSVDDQVEWLDDDHLLYAISRPGNEATVTDVWVTPADGSGTPRIAIPEAGSPAVVRGGTR